MQVKNAAIKALTSASAAMGNKDIENLVPAVISAMANPAQVTPLPSVLLSKGGRYHLAGFCLAALSRC